MVKKKEKKKVELNNNTKFNGLKTGRFSKELDEFKKKTGLVSMEELKGLPIDSYEGLQKKIKLMDEYTVANQRLVDLFGSVGGRAVNALNQVVDLQARLLELEDDCKERGENPLENSSWLRARQMLANEVQFIHKHGLDVAVVRERLDGRKEKRCEDVMFDIGVGDGKDV